ncbi:hypothetical protein [Acetobacter cerevisiae]|nr:hypothetical protein [Acetobacter cerevisiae]
MKAGQFSREAFEEEDADAGNTKAGWRKSWCQINLQNSQVAVSEP